jgi:hypothetical protein
VQSSSTTRLDASPISLTLAVALSFGMIALTACGGTASPPLPSSQSKDVYFKTVTLQSRPPQLTASQSAFRRRSADACVPAQNLALSGINDVNNSVVGTLSNGNAVNLDWTDHSTGYANYITSPIAGGYNIADVQANVTAQNGAPGGGLVSGLANIMQGIVVTTNGNTSVTAGQTVLGDPMNLSIVNNGTALQNIPLSTPITLTHGEVVEWNGTNLSETVTDPSTGGSIVLNATYYPNYDVIAGNPPSINITVVGTNVIMGGLLVTTALTADPGLPGVPCPSAPPIPPASPTPSCPTAPPASAPNPHPTQIPSAPPGCTS